MAARQSKPCDCSCALCWRGRITCNCVKPSLVHECLCNGYADCSGINGKDYNSLQKMIKWSRPLRLPVQGYKRKMGLNHLNWWLFCYHCSGCENVGLDQVVFRLDIMVAGFFFFFILLYKPLFLLLNFTCFSSTAVY